MKSGRHIPGRVSDCWGWWGLEWTRTFRKARGVEEGARAHGERAFRPAVVTDPLCDPGGRFPFCISVSPSGG